MQRKHPDGVIVLRRVFISSAVKGRVIEIDQTNMNFWTVQTICNQACVISPAVCARVKQLSLLVPKWEYNLCYVFFFPARPLCSSSPPTPTPPPPPPPPSPHCSISRKEIVFGNAFTSWQRVKEKDWYHSFLWRKYEATASGQLA